MELYNSPTQQALVVNVINLRLLRHHAVNLLVDPMRPGDHVRTRMRTFDFDAFLFLISEKSLASESCAIELQTAKARRRPLFVALQSGRLPDEYRDRMCQTVDELDTPDGVGRLGKAIREHVTVQRLVQALEAETAPSDVTRNAARALCGCDSSVLAEHLAEVDSIYRRTKDDSTRYWIALAIQHSGTSGALDGQDALTVLERLRKFETEPYPKEGIRRAIAKLRIELSGGGCELKRKR